jgi:signal transduction histidine kinase
MKLRILHKGLILLLFPLLLQVAFFVQLFGLVSNSEVLAQKEARYGRFIELANEMMLLLVKAWVSSTAYNMLVTTGRKIASMEQVFMLYPQDLQDRMAALVSEAKAIKPEGPQGDNLLTYAQDVSREQIALLNQFHAISELDSKLEQVFRLKQLEPRLLAAYKNSFAIEGLRAEQSNALDIARNKATANRNLIKTEVLAGMVTAILLAFVALIFFVKNITSRLSLLMQNAKFVPLGKPLPYKISGTDELAYLDDILHRATEDLQKAAEHRKSITEMLAHDLRAPLTSIKITLSLLLRPEVRESVQTHDEYVTGINRSVTRLIGLIEDLLTIDKLESGKLDLALEYMDLQNVVQEAIETLQSQIVLKKIVCKNDVRSLDVVADRTRIVQVVTNLLSNAIKHSPAGSTITIYIETEGKFVKVFVKDEGPGIPKSKQESIFEKYFQADRADQAEGFGLGLAICKMIVTRHGGKIGVSSVPGQGATFWFSLPFDPEDDL